MVTLVRDQQVLRATLDETDQSASRDSPEGA
jgi:hypothetical protein